MSEQPNLVSNKPPFTSLFLIIVNSFFGLLIGSAAALLVSALFYEGNLTADVLGGSFTPQAAFIMLLIQGVAASLWLIALPWIHVKYIERKPLSPFFPQQLQLGVKLLLVGAATFCFAISISPIAEWNAGLEFPSFLKDFEAWAKEKEDATAELTKAITSFNNIGELLVGVLIIGIIPGIGEEFVFRGLIQTELFRGTRRIHLSIWISAILFSAIHFQFFGFFPRMLLGALFGYLYYWSGTLVVPMFAHFFHNTSTLLILHFYNVDLIETNIEEAESAPWPAVAFAVVITVVLLIAFRKKFATDNRDLSLK